MDRNDLAAPFEIFPHTWLRHETQLQLIFRGW